MYIHVYVYVYIYTYTHIYNFYLFSLFILKPVGSSFVIASWNSTLTNNYWDLIFGQKTPHTSNSFFHNQWRIITIRERESECRRQGNQDKGREYHDNNMIMPYSIFHILIVQTFNLPLSLSLPLFFLPIFSLFFLLLYSFCLNLKFEL